VLERMEEMVDERGEERQPTLTIPLFLQESKRGMRL